MPKVLVVEDSNVFSSIIKKKIEAELNFEVICYSTFFEAERHLSKKDTDFVAALLDLKLPDALDGQIVDLVVSKNIPAIVFTSNYSEELRNTIWDKGVADYILKEGKHNLDYLANIIDRIHKNKSIKTLVVEDSKGYRNYLLKLLEIHRYHTFSATNGEEALKIIEQNPDIKMVITDYSMPEMDGFELTKKIREKFFKDQMIIIGISTNENNSLSARFIKNGANDFIYKKFTSEEFYCRITQNITILEYFNRLKNSEQT
jgi:PleD family two-component response regulator